LTHAQGSLDGRNFNVTLQVGDGTAPPRCSPAELAKTISLLVSGTAALSSPGATSVLRGEKKPVLLKGKEGQVKRDFIMLALIHGVPFSPESQQRITQGSEPGPLGEMGRVVRAAGGFLRFAPLAGGQLETRLFLPAD
jgi:hypothetical protein